MRAEDESYLLSRHQYIHSGLAMGPMSINNANNTNTNVNPGIGFGSSKIPPAHVHNGSMHTIYPEIMPSIRTPDLSGHHYQTDIQMQSNLADYGLDISATSASNARKQMLYPYSRNFDEAKLMKSAVFYGGMNGLNVVGGGGGDDVLMPGVPINTTTKPSTNYCNPVYYSEPTSRVSTVNSTSVSTTSSVSTVGNTTTATDNTAASTSTSATAYSTPGYINEPRSEWESTLSSNSKSSEKHIMPRQKKTAKQLMPRVEQKLEPKPDPRMVKVHSVDQDPKKLEKNLEKKLEKDLQKEPRTTATPITKLKKTTAIPIHEPSITLKNDIPVARADGKYECVTCGKAYSQFKHLRRHAVIHSGVAPFACSVCSKRFHRPDICKRHKQRCDEKLAAGRLPKSPKQPKARVSKGTKRRQKSLPVQLTPKVVDTVTPKRFSDPYSEEMSMPLPVSSTSSTVDYFEAPPNFHQTCFSEPTGVLQDQDPNQIQNLHQSNSATSFGYIPMVSDLKQPAIVAAAPSTSPYLVQNQNQNKNKLGEDYNFSQTRSYPDNLNLVSMSLCSPALSVSPEMSITTNPVNYGGLLGYTGSPLVLGPQGSPLGDPYVNNNMYPQAYYSITALSSVRNNGLGIYLPSQMQ